MPRSATWMVLLAGAVAIAPAAGCAKRGPSRNPSSTLEQVSAEADQPVNVAVQDDETPLATPMLVQRPGFPGPPYKPHRSELLEPTPAEMVAPPVPVADVTGSSASSDEGATGELLEQDPTSAEYVSPTLEVPRSRLIRRREEWTEAEAAADALGRIGASATAEIVAMLEDADPQVRRRGAEILARIGADADEAVPALIRAVEQDADPQVRKAAAFALGQMGPKAEAAVPALTRMLRK